MNILSELTTIFTALDIPVETGVFSDTAPDEYAVITPLTDSFELFCDDGPEYETQEARISIYSKCNYLKLKGRIVRALLAAGLVITNRQYIERENDSGYFHYEIDVITINTIEMELT